MGKLNFTKLVKTAAARVEAKPHRQHCFNVKLLSVYRQVSAMLYLHSGEICGVFVFPL